MNKFQEAKKLNINIQEIVDNKIKVLNDDGTIKTAIEKTIETTMLKEGIYFAALDEANGTSHCMLKVYDDKSHHLRIISQDIMQTKTNIIDLHSNKEVRNLYKFLKEHFENNQKFTHEEYLKYVEDMKVKRPWEEIASEEQWRKELEAEFGADDK
jgi:uncharacterized short protein YbdD (DUF466 family)